MADLNMTKHFVRSGATLTKGTLVYNSERKGLVAKLARFLHKRIKWHRLERIGYEVLPMMGGDFKTPIGIAIDEHTILVNGHLHMLDK